MKPFHRHSACVQQVFHTCPLNQHSLNAYCVPGTRLCSPSEVRWPLAWREGLGAPGCSASLPSPLWAPVCLCSQSYLTLCDPVDCRPPGSCVHGISQARTLDGVVISYSGMSSRPGDWNCVSCVSRFGRQILSHWAAWEASGPLCPPLHLTAAWMGVHPFCLYGLQRPLWKTTFFTSGWASRAGWDILIDRQTDLWWWRLWFVASQLSQTHWSLRGEQMPPWQTVSEIKTLDLRLRLVNQKPHPCLAQLSLQGHHGHERANLGLYPGGAIFWLDDLGSLADSRLGGLIRKMAPE